MKNHPMGFWLARQRHHHGTVTEAENDGLVWSDIVRGSAHVLIHWLGACAGSVVCA